MADLKLVGAVAIKVRPNVKGFKKDTEDGIREKLKTVKAQVTVKAKGDTSELKDDVERAEKEISKKKLSLKVGLDHDSVRNAQQQLDAALKPKKTITVDLKDQGSIDKAQAKLDKMAKKARVEMELAPDEQGYQAVLDKIAAIRRQKITQTIKFKTDDASLDALEAATRAAIHKESLITVSYSNDRASLEKALKQIEAEQKKLKEFQFDVRVDKNDLESARRFIEEELARTPVTLKVDYDDQASLKSTRDKLKSMLSEVTGKKLDVIFDEEHLRAELQKIENLIQEEIPKEKKVDIPVEPTGLEILARQLQFASRARRVPFYVVIDQKSVAVAEGILRSLAGVNTLQSLGRGLESIATKFDTFSLKTAAWSGAIGSVVDSLAYLTSAAFTVGDGMLKVVGLAALAPTALGVLASSMIIFTGVFKDFGAAVNGDTKAMEALTASGQKAATRVREIFQKMREDISSEFWDKAGDGMLRFTETALPAFTKGLTDMSGKLGIIFGKVLDSFSNMSAAGGIETMYKNMGLMFDNATEGATQFWDALNLLGLRGSEFLPQFGTWLTEIATQFHNWLAEADKNGNIGTWINEGVIALQDMWRVGGAVIDQFKAIASAAGLVGQNGLDDFRRNMEHIADVMGGEPWQSQMATIFDGARNGARELNAGLKDMGGVLMDASGFTSTLLILLGQLGGEFLTDLSRTFGNFEFQTGSLESLRGINEMMREIEPGFDRFGAVLGRMSEIAAEVFRGLAPVINSVMRILDNVTSQLEENLAKVSTPLLTLTDNLVNFASGPIQLVVEVLNSLLTSLNGMPGPLRDATVAFVTFLLLRNQFGSFASAVSGLWTKLTTSVVKGAGNIEVATAALNNQVLNGVPSGFRKMADGSIREVNRFGQMVGTGMRAAEAHVSSFKPASIVVPNVAAMRTAVARDMGRFSDSFANGVTTATAKLTAFAPQRIMDSRMGALASTTAARMSTVAARVGSGVDTMVAHVERFKPSSIADRLSTMASGIPAIVGRINGALSLIGGLPGLALGLLGVIISGIGANAAESARQVDELRESLDKTTGSSTVKTLETIATRMSDISEAGDGWANFWRGVVQQSKAGNETLDKLGSNVQDVARIITGSRGEYEKFIGSLKDLGRVPNLSKVGDIMKGLKAPSFVPLAPGDDGESAEKKRIENLYASAAAAAKALKLNPDIFSDPAMQGSINKLTGDIEEQRRQFELSQIAAKLYGDQLGLSSVKGQQMSAAMAVIRDTSLDATSKIDAMNRAMQLLNDGGLSEQEAAIHKADALERLAENAKNLAESIAGSRNTLFKEGTGMLNDQNAAARGLFDIMREGADNVKISAKAAYDAALAEGKTAEQAMGKAREALKAGDGDLKRIADNAGVTVDELKAQWGKFFNEPWVLQASITGTNEQYKLAMAEAERLGLTFDEKTFTAWLMANPDPAKVTTEEVKAYMQAEATKKYNATLGALPDEAQGVLAALLGQLTAYETDDYSAILKAFNNAGPGVQDTLRTLATVPPEKLTVFKAMIDAGMYASVQAQLDTLAGTRLATFGVRYEDQMGDSAMANRMRNGGAYNGAILNGRGQGMHGFGLQPVKYFANGGIERHVAQIASGRGPVRVWAEAETQGEAYIPYAQSKRPRSLAILAQVAKDFGYTLSRATESYANGGLAGHAGPSTTNNASVTIGTLVTTDADAAVRKIRTSQQDALAVAGITLNGA